MIKFLTREELANRNLDYVNEILAGEKHDHPVYLDENGTLRWQGDPLIDEMFNRGYIDLNAIFSRSIKPIVGIEPKVKPTRILKNDPLIRELYRRLGYSLYGYWEVFYWEVNNSYADKYVDQVPIFQYPK